MENELALQLVMLEQLGIHMEKREPGFLGYTMFKKKKKELKIDHRLSSDCSFR